MINELIDKLDWEKMNNLIPCIVQDEETKVVLMLGYMSKESLVKTKEIGNLVFYSRSKGRVWMKGETSGNVLKVVKLEMDCDRDTILARVKPKGPVCHTGSDTCWGLKNELDFQLYKLEKVIKSRRENPRDSSYTTSLFAKGINKIAQKVGEEAIELVIEAKDNNRHLFLNEAADLMYHYMVLLQAKGFKLEDVEKVLREREK